MYFQVVPSDTNKEEFESLLFNELFDMPCVKSVVSSCDLNGMISESCEFIEMNNSSIHPSRIFRSQLSNSCAASINKDMGLISRSKGIDKFDNKENMKNDDTVIQNMLTHLKHRIQFSGFNSSKKQAMLKLVIDLNTVLNSEAESKSYVYFGKPLDGLPENMRVDGPFKGTQNFKYLN